MNEFQKDCDIYMAVGGIERCSECRQRIRWCTCPPISTERYEDRLKGICMGCGYKGSAHRDTCPQCGDILLTMKRSEVNYTKETDRSPQE